MSKDFRIGNRDFSGGMNQAPHGSTLADNEVTDLMNLYPFAKKLRKRPARNIVLSGLSAQITGMLAFKTGAGVWSLMVFHATGLSKWAGVGLPTAISTAYASSTLPWRARQYVGIGYAVRRATGTLKRFTPGMIENAGLAAFLAAPSVAQGAAGSLTAGTYQCAVTKYNMDTGVESNPSPLASVTIGANTTIDWTVSAGTESQVNARRLYRSAVNQLAPLFRVRTLEDNSTLLVPAENTLTANFGPAMSFRNGVPPDNLELLEVFKERMWVSDGVDLYPSELANVESFYSLSKIQVSPDDGHKIVGLLNWPIGDDSRLAIAKTNSVWYIYGTDLADFQLKNLSDKVGCISQESMKTVEGLLIWFEGDNFYASDGGKPRSISDTKIRTLLDSLPAAYKSTAVAAIYPRLGWYVCSLQTAADGSRSLVVYNYRTDAWTVFGYGTGNATAPSVLADFFDTNGQRLLYGSFGGTTLYDMVGSNFLDDYLTEYLVRVRTGDLVDGGRDLALKNVAIASNKSTGLVDLGVFINGDRDTDITQAFKYRQNLEMYVDQEWRTFNLSTMQKYSPTLAVQLHHTGNDDLEISGIMLEGVGYETRRQPL
jgi:hypothetical protein